MARRKRGTLSSAENTQETAEDAARRFAGYLVAVEKLHEPRFRDVEGYTLRWCRECGQNWPCPTMSAVRGEDDAR